MQLKKELMENTFAELENDMLLKMLKRLKLKKKNIGPKNQYIIFLFLIVLMPMTFRQFAPLIKFRFVVSQHIIISSILFEIL